MAWTRSPIGFAMLLTLVLAAPPAAAANPTTAEACFVPDIVCARGTLSGALAYCEGTSSSWTCHVDWTLDVVTRGPESCGDASTPSPGPKVDRFCSIIGDTDSESARLTYVNTGSADLSGTVCSSVASTLTKTCKSIPVASVPLPPPPPPSGGGGAGLGDEKHGKGKVVKRNGNGPPATGIHDLDGLVTMGIAYLP